MKKKIVISGPILSRSGYGEMARFALRSLKRNSELDIFITPTNWGNTGNLFEVNSETEEINILISKTEKYLQETGGKPNFDTSIQVTIPNEWKNMAKYNIGYTAGIETNMISPAWFEPSMGMNKIIVISNHAKSGFDFTVFGDQAGNQFKVATQVDVCHFPVRDYEPVDLNIELKHDFNFLAVCQWSARKNLEQTIIGFIEEFKNEEVGLVLKINTSNDSLLDREHTEARLFRLLSAYKDRKCSIHLLHGHMSEAEMHALFKHPKIKCAISTTRGEGFGFPLFEAAYSEMPVVATDWSGHLDFLTMKDEDGKEKKMFAKVDYELKPIEQQHVWQGVLEAGSQWAYPLASSYKSKIREVYKDYPRFKSWAKKLNKWVRQEFTEEKTFDRFLDIIGEKKANNVKVSDLPKISIFASVYNSDEYIEQYLEDVTRQTIFKDKCELVLINPNSPGNEEPIIKKYMEKFPNIKYVKWDKDPGIYETWNEAIRMCEGEFVTNANIDDRKAPHSIERHAKELFANKDIDLVYADSYIVHESNKQWENVPDTTEKYTFEDFSLDAMLRGSQPHNNPMWRKSLHDKFGWFDNKYKSAADWDFWLRCAFGESKFLKINEILGIYYFNPTGISTNPANRNWKKEEEKEIFKKYLNIYQEKMV